MDHIVFIRHPSMDTRVASTLLAAVSNAAVNVGVHVSVCALLSILPVTSPGVGLLDPMAILCLTFRRPASFQGGPDNTHLLHASFCSGQGRAQWSLGSRPCTEPPFCP